jgi:hypothetical protein
MWVVQSASRRDLSLYGVMPASSFLSLVAHPLVRLWDGVTFSGAPPPPPLGDDTAGSSSSRATATAAAVVVVLGCSIGWACVYAAAALGVPSRGVDLLQSRIDYGKAVLRRHAPHLLHAQSSSSSSSTPRTTPMPPMVELLVDDARRADVRDAALILEITSFGDTPVRQEIWGHIARTAPEGAVVVSYDARPLDGGANSSSSATAAATATTADIARTAPEGAVVVSYDARPLDGGANSSSSATAAAAATTADSDDDRNHQDHDRSFEHRGVVELPTSWSPKQPFHVYAVRRGQQSPPPLPPPPPPRKGEMGTTASTTTIFSDNIDVDVDARAKVLQVARAHISARYHPSSEEEGAPQQEKVHQKKEGKLKLKSPPVRTRNQAEVDAVVGSLEALLGTGGKLSSFF